MNYHPMDHFEKFLIVLFFVFPGMRIMAQTTIPSSGGNATGTGGTANYTIGQIVFPQNSGTGGSITQGVQQPYEISVVTAVVKAKIIDLVCSAYPNPTSDFLTLKIGSDDRSNLSFWVYDVNGKVLQNKKVGSNETKISMQNLLPGTYFLKVADNGKRLQIFKIIKN